MIVQAHGDDPLRLGEDALDLGLVAAKPIERKIVRSLRVNGGSAGGDIEVRIDFLDVQFDQFGGIPRLVQRFGRDKRNRLADEVDPVQCQDRANGGGGQCSVGQLESVCLHMVQHSRVDQV